MGNHLLKAFKSKRQAPAYSAVEIGHWILPPWFIRQVNPLNSSYQWNNSFANLSCRNWTGFCNEWGEQIITVDGDGIFSFVRSGVSLEIWVNDGAYLYTPGKYLRTEQKATPEFPCVETESRFDNGFYKSRVFPIESFRNRIFGLEFEVGANGADPFNNFLFFLVIRPYDHNGLSAIRKLEFKNRRMRVNNYELFYLDSEPEAVFCTDAREGDVTDYFKLEIARSSVTSWKGSCTALLGYSIRPADRTIIRLYHKPDSFTMFVKQEIDFSKNRFFDSKQLWISRYNYQHRMIKTDSEIDSIFHANLNYLKMFNGPRSNSTDIYQLLALNRFAFYRQSRSYLLKTLKKVRWDGSIGSGYLPPEKLIYALTDYYQFSKDFKIIEENWQILKRIGLWLIQNISALAVETKPRDLINLGWICASLRALSLLNEDKGELEDSRFFQTHFQKLKARMLEFFTRVFKENARDGFRKVGSISDNIDNLSLSYPLRLYEQRERFVNKWLNLIIEDYTYEGGVISPLEFGGVDLILTARLGLILLREGLNHDPVFRFFRDKVSSTGTWPDRIHPVNGNGIGAAGHSPDVGCHFLLFLRDLMVMEEREVLYLLPGVFTSALWREPQIELQCIPTLFGEISLKCESIGKVTQIKFNPSFRQKPRQIRLILDSRDRLIYADSKVRRAGNCLELENDFKIARIRRDL
ncbi:MAG: hypothetical protein GX075_04215 [Firmicutes bacterium]|nr:hypothetical protein [Bacillota bacterium]